MTYASGTVLFAYGDCDDAVELAKAYIVDNGYNAETVKMVKREGAICVVVK